MNGKNLNDILSNIRHLNTWVPKVFENELGINVIRYEIMTLLLEYKELSQNELQQHLDIDRAAITRHIQILEEKGNVSRVKDPRDSRAILVSLTHQGVMLLERCDNDHEAMLSKITQDLGEEQIEKVAKALNQLKENVIMILGKKDKNGI